MLGPLESHTRVSLQTAYLAGIKGEVDGGMLWPEVEKAQVAVIDVAFRVYRHQPTAT
jgi:hypothetical protein